ncbi:MAG: porin [Microscillaceae bacterium]|nr:porin [Microscillaceae bacterium]MDW8461844.1 porin [Cytophagales bacterium]
MKPYLFSFILLTITILFHLKPLFAQLRNDTTNHWKIETSAYIETYFAFDFAQPTDNERPAYVFNHKRHNEFNVNHGIIETTIRSEKVRGNIALMIGTYSQYNLINEQELIRNIYEGNAGFKPFEKHNFWIDAGIFASHIGFESAISKNCWTLSRSLLADNTPYYEAGIKGTYTSKNEKWILVGLILNGWQRIRKLPNNSMPSFGTQVQYKPTQTILLNSSTYIGNEGTDNLKQMRYFHNFYGQFDLSPRSGLIVGFDYGIQTHPSIAQIRSWHASSTILRYRISPKWTLCCRIEHYWDRDNLFVFADLPSPPVQGFRVWGYSLNLDYAPAPNMLVRIDARQLHSPDQILTTHQSPSQHNLTILASIAVEF